MTFVFEPGKEVDKKEKADGEKKPDAPVDEAKGAPSAIDDAAQKAEWQAAAQASAIVQEPDEPPPRYYTDTLDVELTPQARLEAAIKSADLRDRIDAFDEETKAMVAERKAERADLVSKAREAGDAARTGRVRAEVQCAEIVSFKTNSKWRVRLDRNDENGLYERIGREQPLSDADRQAVLPMADEECDESPTETSTGDGPPKLKLVKGRKGKKK